MRARLLPVALLPCLVTLAGCGTTPTLPTPVHEADSYGLSPPPELRLPQDEPLGESESVPTPEPSAGSLAPPGDIWVRLRAGFQLPRDRLEIRDWARRLAADRGHLNSTLRRAEPFLWHMADAVEQRGMPMELALLPAIESAYDPYAYSPSHASGLWQFLPGTGDRFGLRRNWWYDGRRDVTESTRAALDYLSYLHDMFGDWMLALAAYNSGEGRVQRALKDNESRGVSAEVWALSLPRETRDYVPRLLGLAELLSHPEEYGYDLQPLPDGPRLEVVELPGQVELSLAAELAGMELEELQRFNPGFRRWATDPAGPHRLLVPQELAGNLRREVEQLPPERLLRWQHYVTEEGDTLPSIARRYGVQLAVLQQMNGLSGRSVLPGTELRIPHMSGQAPAEELAEAEAAATPAEPPRTYTVRPGDSLWRVAKKHGLRVKDLARWNNLSPSDTLRPGHRLVLGADRADASGSRDAGEVRAARDGAAVSSVAYYTVRNGDSLTTIAQRFKVSISDLQRWNSLGGAHLIKAGQRLKVSVESPRTTGT